MKDSNVTLKKEQAIQVMDGKEVSNVMERVLLAGDLSLLSPEDRVKYYMATCQSVRLNPLTKPFEYINLNGKLTLYAGKGTAEQLRNIHKISIIRLETLIEDNLLTVIAFGQDSEGRTDVSKGCVWIGTSTGTLKGEGLANAHMKAETKAKRRLTLSMCGLGMLDESELEGISDKQKYEEYPQIDINLVNTTLAKFTVSIGETTDIETLKECFAEGYRELNKLKDREGGKEALKSLNQVYLNKKQEFSGKGDKDEAVI